MFSMHPTSCLLWIVTAVKKCRKAAKETEESLMTDILQLQSPWRFAFGSRDSLSGIVPDQRDHLERPRQVRTTFSDVDGAQFGDSRRDGRHLGSQQRWSHLETDASRNQAAAKHEVSYFFLTLLHLAYS